MEMTKHFNFFHESIRNYPCRQMNKPISNQIWEEWNITNLEPEDFRYICIGVEISKNVPAVLYAQ